MKKVRKVMALALALTLTATAFTVPVYAVDEQTAVVETADEAAAPDAPVYDTAGTPDVNGFIVENGVLTGYEGIGGDVVIPDGVTTLALRVFKDNTKVRTVTMPDSVTGFKGDMGSAYDCGFGTFKGCTNLFSVKLSKNLTNIGPGAFRECPSLKSIEIPDSVTAIGRAAFSKTPLETITWSKNLTAIYAESFIGAKITELEMPDTVTYIGFSAFEDCTELKSVSISDSIEDSGFGYSYTGQDAFAGCTSLKTIKFGKKMQTIHETMFAKCTSLTDLVIPENILKLDEECFKDCTSLVNVDLGNIEYFNRPFLRCENIKKLLLPNTLTTVIGYGGAFPSMSGVEVFQIPASYNDISKEDWRLETAFKNLKELYIDVNTACFGVNDFKGSTKLVDIYYTGTKEDWDKKVVYCNPDIFLVNNMDNYIIHCSDGPIIGKNVVQKTVVGITVIAPTKKEYAIGEALDVTGGSIKVTYSDKTISDPIPLTLDMCSGFDSSTAGQKTVTVTYEGKTATFKVTVKKGAAPVAQNVTIDGEPVKSITTALKKIKSGDHTIIVTANYTEKSITIPKGLGTVTLICDGGVTLTTDTITANSNLVLDDVTLAGTKAGKYTVVKANADFTANTGTYSNITVKGKADLSDLTVNGNVKLTAKADKDGLVTDTLTNVTVTKGVSSNNNVIFADCPSLGTINVKGTVKITGEATKAVALTASSKSGISEVENLTVDKKVSIAGNFIASGLTANNAVDVKGDAKITDSNIAGKLSAKGLLNVNGDVYCANAVSCGQLTSDETAHLTYQSLAVTKGGIAANSADITVKVIDKKGSTVRFVAGDKKAVVVKSLKLPKGGTYNAVLILDEDCGTGTLTFEKNKVVLK